MNILWISFIIFLAVISSSSGQNQGPSIFPYPASIKYGSSNATLSSSSFQIATTSTSQVLAAAIARYKGIIFPFHELNIQDSSVSLLQINVNSNNENLQFGVDESYTLAVDGTTTATITANTIYGAMHGLESFSQLVTWNETTTSYQVSFVPIVIQDAPRFPWRGLMIDTARHFLTKATILRTLDAMSYSKFNTLHWHIVDAQSFPIQSTTFPTLSQFGAYSPRAVYTPQDVSDIITYAQQRGIRVLPEFDVPGHAASWGKAYNITAYCPAYMANINNIALDPSKTQTYQILDGLLTEMAQRFSDSYIHLGGDEVVFGCWNENADIQKWARANNLDGGAAIEDYFENQLQKMVAKNGKTMVCWQELFNNNIALAKGTIVEIWQDAPTALQVVNAGYQGIIAYPYYLDKQSPNSSSSHYEWVDTWQDFYKADPLSGLSGKHLDLIVGGEACMWAEQVDSTNFDSRVWPRACGVAERLWSLQSQTDIKSAISRLVTFRCHLAQRGIGAGPIAPDYCPLPDESRFNKL